MNTWDAYVQGHQDGEARRNPGHITVHQHRAPTDESVRLLKEFQDKAVNELYNAVTLDTNTFKAKWVYHWNPMSFGQKATCLFDLNGERHRLEIDLPDYCNTDKEHVQQIMEAVQKEVARILSIELFMQCRETFKR